jgi:hypothetical protein
MKSLKPIRILVPFRLIGAFMQTCDADRRRARNSSALNVLQFGVADLALMLPNRGVAMVY